MNCCFCGPVKNCGPYLLKVFDNIEKLASLFEDYMIVIYYDHSTDNTLEILREYQIKNPKLIFYVNSKPVSPYRTHNIANARNFCLKYVRSNIQQFPFFIMMDFDDVNCKEVNIQPLRKYLYSNSWDGLSFNSSPAYYDIWGLSIYPYCFSYNHFNDNNNYHRIIKDYIMSKLNSLKPGQLLACISSFNGFSIYRTNKFLDTYYDGRVRSDLFSKKLLNTHAKAQKSRTMVYIDYGHIKGQFEDCEHRAFHQMARKKSGARIMISSEILFY
jgi:glycosyltransferase involved in cell wall biosynthesis